VFTYRREVLLADLASAVRINAVTLEDLPASQRHVRFNEVIDLVGEAWMAFLRSLGEELLPQVAAVVHVSCDYSRDVKLGELAIDLRVTRIGRSSFALGFALQQGGATPATGDLVLVHQDWITMAAKPLSEVQRSLLEQHLDPAPG
jgi:acyl-CoA thioesterase FadM